MKRTRGFKPQQGVVVFAKNKKRVSAFYRQTLSLVAEESESSHDLLRGGAYEVIVHAVPRKYADAAWHFRGCAVLDGWDPEGNVVQFKQRTRP